MQVCEQREFVKKLFSLTKYTHNVNSLNQYGFCYKTACNLYRETTASNLFYYTGRPGGSRRSDRDSHCGMQRYQLMIIHIRNYQRQQKERMPDLQQHTITTG